MTISFANQDPAPSETGVLTTKHLSFRLDDDTTPIAQVDTKIYITHNDGEDLAYDGSTTGWQAPYSGDAPTGWGTQQVTFGNVYVGGGWFEDTDVAVRSTVGVQDTGPYSFEIETLGFMRNSGAEAPGTASLDAKGWTRMGGAERQKAPPSLPPPSEGEFVFTLIDDLAFPTYSQARSFAQLSADLTGVAFVEVQELIDFPTIDAGDLVDLWVLVDSDIVYHRQLTSADSGFSSAGSIKVPTSSYTGVHLVSVYGAWTKSGDQVFVDGVAAAMSTSFEDWLDALVIQVWDEGTATAAVFNGTDDHETFEVWL